MSKHYKNESITKKLSALPDSEIDHSDISELDTQFWANAKAFLPGNKQCFNRLGLEMSEF